ncbi:kinetochore Sim4 complex subunit FTA2-domain-containing protein [Podospora appendiculata]|uniref:Kinetochore Sim4 complex subunit FTA2-domain-containing protein n=1 Tax=Podospora appendiculata TaxID=314037 RepID=A0AAE0WZX0_9PEZI|nr:kinetochore Sim4 complex subunit FTA2-domain-containing protein [Podospora appendiculata]
MPTAKPLPDCEGPKLEPFADSIFDLNIKFLGIITTADDGGRKAIVMKARIGRKIYAVKIFQHRSNTIYDFGSDYLQPLTTGDSATDGGPRVAPRPTPEQDKYVLPFFCECRAYGRLKETGREDLAARAHGYLSFVLTEEVRNLFNNAIAEHASPTQGDILSVLGLSGDLALDPVFAIVKDWIDHPPYDDVWDIALAESALYPRMPRNLKALHKLGIVVRDINLGQYVNGVLVDLSSAWTAPHCFGPETGIRLRWEFLSQAAWDLYCFQTQVIDAYNGPYRRMLKKGELLPEVSFRVYSPPEMLGRLRPRPHRQQPYLPLLGNQPWLENQFLTEMPPFDPSRFNWVKAQVGRGRLTAKNINSEPKPTKKRRRKARGLNYGCIRAYTGSTMRG